MCAEVINLKTFENSQTGAFNGACVCKILLGALATLWHLYKGPGRCPSFQNAILLACRHKIMNGLYLKFKSSEYDMAP